MPRWFDRNFELGWRTFENYLWKYM